jgi:PilZ domain
MTVAAVPTKCRMPSVPDDQTLSQVERLLGELRLIELWDADYWRKCHPEGYERHAFVARRKRRAEILPQLVSLIPPGWTLRSRGSMDRLESERNQNPENRRHRRLEFGTEVTIRSATESLPGRTLDISKTGMSALLPAELEVGEVVDLNIKTSIGLTTGRAVVRNRNVFRHGFEFLRPCMVWLGRKQPTTVRVAAVLVSTCKP